MKNNFNKTVKHAQKFVLTKDEKAQIRSALEIHIAENPPTGEILWKEIPKRKPVLSFLQISDLQRYMVPAFALVLIVSVGVLASASQSALPGDVLYPIKILNEQVESGLALNQDSVAKIDDMHSLTRLEEAETLEVQGKLDDEKKATIATSFQNTRRNSSKENNDRFVRNLPQPLQSIAVAIDPSLDVATSSDKNQNENRKGIQRRWDFRLAKQKDKNANTAAAMAVSARVASSSATSTSTTGAQINVNTESHSESTGESSHTDTGNDSGGGGIKIGPITVPKL